MHTINCKSGAGSFEAAEYFMQHKRQTKVSVNMGKGEPKVVWHYKGSRKDLAAVYDNMVMVAEWPQEE